MQASKSINLTASEQLKQPTQSWIFWLTGKSLHSIAKEGSFFQQLTSL